MANWIALVDKQTGRLHSLGTIPAEGSDLAYDVIDLGATPPDFSTVQWDAATRAFVPRPVQVFVDRADEMRDRLQAAFQADAQFMAAFQTLTPANRATLRTRMDAVLTAQLRILLGALRFRLDRDTPEVG